MMGVARAKELNEGEPALVSNEEQAKPVVLALREIAEGLVLPATHDEMKRIRNAKRVVRDRALRIAEQEGLQAEEDSDDSYASAHSSGNSSEGAPPKGDPVES
ncbi:MAG: DNA-directed RNA polymerase subunit omega [bacterium]|nr:DNA-directed RNA polymerase subunit omega [bacterium]